MGIIGKIDGVRAIDGGSRDNSMIVEQFTALFLDMACRNKKPWVGIRLTGI